jgi:hypothetical protein
VEREAYGLVLLDLIGHMAYKVASLGNQQPTSMGYIVAPVVPGMPDSSCHLD